VTSLLPLSLRRRGEPSKDERMLDKERGNASVKEVFIMPKKICFVRTRHEVRMTDNIDNNLKCIGSPISFLRRGAGGVVGDGG
jgi:hypothetical protein